MRHGANLGVRAEARQARVPLCGTRASRRVRARTMHRQPRGRDWRPVWRLPRVRIGAPQRTRILRFTDIGRG